ncbi:MAG TPA: ABC transporter substrate-binding protein, partial [bacterium]|nr:ABC transporter substrate-binding protein [bacterium]
PVIGPGGPPVINNPPDIEPLMKVKPDVLFTSLLDASKADRLQDKIRIPVVVLSYGDFASFDDTVFDSLRLLGRIFKKDGRAEEVVGFVRGKIADLKRRAAKTKGKPSVYVGALGFKGTQGIESTDASYVPFEWLSANNAAKEISPSGHLFINMETLLKLDPEIIFIDGGGREAVSRDFARKREIYNQLEAFRERRVYALFPFNWYTTNIGTALADAYAIGKAVSPGAFRDIDIRSVTNDIYSFLVGEPLYDEMAADYGQPGQKISF